MAHYESYQSNAAEAPIMRRWLLVALVLSILLHIGLYFFLNYKRLENFGYTGEERLAPPVRVLKQVKIPDLPDTDTKLVLPDKVPNTARIAIPEDKPEVQEVKVTPSTPDITKPIVSEKPKAAPGGFDALEKAEASSLTALEKQLSSMAGSVMEKSTKAPRQPSIVVPTGSKTGEGGTGSTAGIPGRQSLDEALARTGPLPTGSKPIGMKGGALFEYNSAELRTEAVEDLRKLGELIKRNPKSTFVISGHTDHTGTREYNLRLSQQRADSVRDWLVANFGIDPQRITTIGKADDEAFPDLGPDKSVDEQAPNRRVEIVIKTNRK